jgi:isopenicillin-N epimerase
VPTAIEFMETHNWLQVAASCRKLVKENAPAFCELLGSEPLAPVNDDFILQLFSAEIKAPEPEKLYRHFFDNYKIEIPVMRHGDKVYLRYSINAFNSQQDFDNLFAAIKDIKMKTRLIG